MATATTRVLVAALIAGVAIPVVAAAADPPGGDVPLEPRRETPEEEAERARWPRFLTPSELRHQ